MNWQKVKSAFKRAFNQTFQFNSLCGFLFWVATTMTILTHGSEVGKVITVILSIIMALIFVGHFIRYYKMWFCE